MKLLVTGGLGFIGSNFVREHLRRFPDDEIVNLDRLTYAGNRENLKDVEKDKRYRWEKADICDPRSVRRSMKGCDVVVHFAAETHVDRAILRSGAFLKTNVMGTQVLLEAAVEHKINKFIHIGTDEVYGSIEGGRSSREDDPLVARSPYSASKAAGDILARSYHVTYGLPIVVTRASNNFGPYQHPEKALPLLITNALEGKPFPLYGDGRNVRDWLFVEDHCRAIELVLEKGAPGEIYNVGGTASLENVELVTKVLDLMGKPRELIRFVPDRPGHDRRYSLDCGKLRRLGWEPTRTFEEALLRTIDWYIANEGWWKKLKNKSAFKRYYETQYARRLKEGKALAGA